MPSGLKQITSRCWWVIHIHYEPHVKCLRHFGQRRTEYQIMHYKGNNEAWDVLIYISKDKSVPLHAMEALGDRRYSSYSFSISALDGGEWSASRPGHALPPGKGPPPPGTHCTGGWLGPRAGLDTEARGKSICLCQGSNLDRPTFISIHRKYCLVPVSGWLYLFPTSCKSCLHLQGEVRIPELLAVHVHTVPLSGNEIHNNVEDYLFFVYGVKNVILFHPKCLDCSETTLHSLN
jgi:hypothetical protein